MRLGSLFDGIGGFPLAATRCGISPAWASEIEPYPITVTKKRFPGMIHLGDVTKIHGGNIEPVDVITFGSPCQDLSIAGKQSGLGGSRSSLFYEAVRIIEEMREATGGRYPTFALWENVPGAFSSNGGQDFRAVLEALSKAEVPMPRSGKWATAGMVRGHGRSLAWRVLDAQHWGVPQRRRRIFLIVDLGGERAPEILFERQSLRGDSSEGREAGQGPSRRSANRTSGRGATALRMRSGCEGGGKGDLVSEEVSLTLATGNDQTLFAPQTAYGFKHKQGAAAGGIGYAEEQSPTLLAEQMPAVIHPAIVGTLCASGAGLNRPAGMGSEADLVIAFAANQRDEVRDLGDTAGAIQAQPGMKQQTFLATTVYGHRYIVRRLTPLECERLQGYPDLWTEGGSDSARYKACGNSVAVPCVQFIIERITTMLGTALGINEAAATSQ